ncbi:unnamed protein product, partial [Prorocentrum cordatum]
PFFGQVVFRTAARRHTPPPREAGPYDMAPAPRTVARGKPPRRRAQAGIAAAAAALCIAMTRPGATFAAGPAGQHGGLGKPGLT